MTSQDPRAALAQLLQSRAEAPQPLAPAQERLWFLEQLEPGSPLYAIPFTIELTGLLDRGALERALGEIIRRHAPLRTTFDADAGGRPYTLVHPFEPGVLPVTDLTELPAGARQPEAARLAEAEARRPFDLAQGPLIRCTLYRLDAERHWLQINLHHIIADGISVGVLLHELRRLLAGQLLPDLPTTYVAYARRQQERLAAGALAPHLEYWKRQLGASLPPALQLPTDRPRPAVLGHRGAAVTIPLATELMAPLKALARHEGVTLFMLLQAAFQTLLHRYTRQTDIAVGTPVGGRETADSEQLIGLFVNTLVLRTDLSGGPTFRELLRRVRQTCLEGYAHQDVPFARLVEELHPTRELGSSPLFQVLFALESGLADLSLPGLQVEQVMLHSGTAKFEISTHLQESADGLQGWWEYNCELFDEATIRRMAAQYEVLLGALLANPDAPIDQLEILPAQERELLLTGFNQTAADYPRDGCVHHLVEAQVKATPDRIAVDCESTILTYAELDAQANQMAHYLRQRGVGPDSLVGVCLERSAAMITALLGVLKAGGAYVPMDPNYPPERLRSMIEDAAMPVLLTQSSLQDRLPATDAVVICIDADGPAIQRESTAQIDSGATPENVAYVIFTSGSTGRPKGVQVLHRGVVNVLTWYRRYHHITADDVMLGVTSISFDIAETEIYIPLITGGKLVLAAQATDGQYIASLLTRHKVTFMQGTPATWRILLASGWQSYPGLTMIIGGEPLPRELADRLTAGGGVLVDQYGPTETTIWSSYWTVEPNRPIVIGRPVANTQIYLLDDRLQPVPIGVPGELYIGGDGLARGYLNRPDLTADRFRATPYGRVYRTGDLARFLPSGEIEYLGRIDHQVKIRGFRIELGEVEAVLEHHPAIAQAVVVARPDGSGEHGLVAYYLTRPSQAPTVTELRAHLKQTLPDYMLPSIFMPMASMPLTPSGKVDRRALPEPEGLRPELEAAFVPPSSSLEKGIAAIWQEVLRVEQVGRNDNFFDLGGHSLLLVQVHARLRERLQAEISLMELFQYPTVSLLAQRVRSVEAPALVEAKPPRQQPTGEREIAIIGMAGRFPGAPDIEAFWQNLLTGTCTLRRFTKEELLEAGEDPALVNDPHFVPVKGTLDDADRFDAGFFAIPPREAETLDPQQRQFLEVAWTALEHAGYDPDRFPGRIGLFASAGWNTYLISNLLRNPAHVAAVGMYQIFLNSDKDFLTSRTAYKLNLKGPAVTIQTACSSSLVAVHEAAKSLLAGECEMALAGGTSVTTPLKEGYVYSEGHIASPDGACRAFDADAAGTVPGSGVGAVLLKRLADAIRDGDTIHAVIRGSAVGNDGALKVGFTAPSVDGQAAVVADALTVAGVDPDSVGYIECHGTGTVLGDPIEVAGLTKAYRSLGARSTQSCALGSLKPNMGHMDAAAGVAGLLKATLAVKRGEIPPTLGFRRPNPKIDFAASPFYVSAERKEWRPDGPRRAGVSAFGVGGTNAHICLEQPPERTASGPSRPSQLLLLSARSPQALQAAANNLTQHLASHPAIEIADVAYTLSVGRKDMSHRRAVVRRPDSSQTEPITARDGGNHPVAFLFPGQGAQFIHMGRDLYASEPVYRDVFDRCCQILQPEVGDLREILTDEQRLSQTRYTQPALFVVEYAMAQLWQSWGVKPQVLIGHSLGEYVAACLAGVFTLEDALRLVAARGRLIQSLPAGAMLSVAMSERDLLPWLAADVAVSAVNGPNATVVSGPAPAIEALQDRLEADGVLCRRLRTAHAFHSAMLDPILPAFESLVQRVKLSPPKLPFISNVTGTWINPVDSADPRYWSRHMRQTVRFADGLKELFADPDRVLLEVGPGQTLTTFARQHPDKGTRRLIVPSGRHVKESESDVTALLTAAARLWTAGQVIDWSAFWAGQQRHRVVLPTYPFERQRYWVEPVTPGATAAAALQDAAVTTPQAHERPDLDVAYEPPTTEIEQAIAAIWSELLGIAQVGVSDSFFDLGGDSLVASRVIARLRESFPIEIPLGAIFQTPSLGALARTIERLLIEKLEAMSEEELAALTGEKGGASHGR